MSIILLHILSIDVFGSLSIALLDIYLSVSYDESSITHVHNNFGYIVHCVLGSLSIALLDISLCQL